jgi:hypothetical protein
LPQAFEIGACFLDGCHGLQHLGVGRGQCRLGLGDGVLEFGEVQAREHLAFFHPVVVVDEHCFDGAGQLAAHLDLVDWRQFTRRRNRNPQIASVDRFGLIAGRRLGFGTGTEERETTDAQRGEDACHEQPAYQASKEVAFGRSHADDFRQLRIVLHGWIHDDFPCALATVSTDVDDQPPPSAL